MLQRLPVDRELWPGDHRRRAAASACGHTLERIAL